MALTKHISLSKPHSSIPPDRSSIQQRILHIADYFLHRWRYQLHLWRTGSVRKLIAYSFQKDKQEIQVQNQNHHVGENWTLQPTLGCYGNFHETMST
jgi:hypothetical protein